MKAALHTVIAAPELPAYVPSGNECALFEHAWRRRLPVLLKGPTGCGKTRFVAHMAARLGLPLHTVACHDDLTAADLTGRYLLQGGDTVWTDRKSTRLNSSHPSISYAVFCLKKKKKTSHSTPTH